MLSITTEPFKIIFLIFVGEADETYAEIKFSKSRIRKLRNSQYVCKSLCSSHGL